ncbi:hypothetical protein OC861_002546 [Tilletia horrida]|nr:hypothetical protein OC861_002546 [Tilletia horrida]
MPSIAPSVTGIDQAWLKTSKAVQAAGTSDGEHVDRVDWFRSEPLTPVFVNRLAQLQLCTNSRDQGWASQRDHGSWSWFEVALLDGTTFTPRKFPEGREMVWISHFNQLAEEKSTLHYGRTFDRRSELLANMDVGDVIQVRVCARFQGWKNFADSAWINTRLFKEDIFTTDRWTLASQTRPTVSGDHKVEDVSFIFGSSTSCTVAAVNDKIVSKIWFSTPALDQKSINNLEALQLFTRACFKRIDQPDLIKAVPGESFSWFDIVILESPTATQPRVRDGVTLAWLSHANQYNNLGVDPTAGKLFDDAGSKEEQDEMHISQLKTIKAALEPGNAIGVRVCAQFQNWQNVADYAHLVVRFDNTKTETFDLELPSVSAEVENAAAIQAAINEIRGAVAEGENVPAVSRASTLLTAEVRADQTYTKAGLPAYEETLRPLRLLSLDGGGVRGVSELEILEEIMKRVKDTEGREYQVHEYFDMIAGTSTGALLAMMLGRLKMSIEDCKTAYDRISKEVFSVKTGWVIRDEVSAFIAGNYMYESAPLVKEVTDLVKKYLEQHLKEKTGDTCLLDPTNKPETDACKVLVMTCRADETNVADQTVHLRSWVTPGDVPAEYPKIKIWQAARATSAAPAYFQRLTCDLNELVDVPEGTVNGTVSFIDGGMVENNPVLELMSEAILTYGPKRKVGCIVSLGTGIPAKLVFSKGALPVGDVISMLTNSEKPVRKAQSLSLPLPLNGVPKFFRFNLSAPAVGDSTVDGKMMVKSLLQKVKPYSEGSEKDAKLNYAELFKKMDDWRNLTALRTMTEDWIKKTARPELEKCVGMLTAKDWQEKTMLVAA